MIHDAVIRLSIEVVSCTLYFKVFFIQDQNNVYVFDKIYACQWKVRFHSIVNILAKTKYGSKYQIGSD